MSTRHAALVRRRRIPAVKCPTHPRPWLTHRRSPGAGIRCIRPVCALPAARLERPLSGTGPAFSAVANQSQHFFLTTVFVLPGHEPFARLRPLLSRPFRPAAVQALFQRADRDGGGSLDLDEFMGAFGKVGRLFPPRPSTTAWEATLPPIHSLSRASTSLTLF